MFSLLHDLLWIFHKPLGLLRGFLLPNLNHDFLFQSFEKHSDILLNQDVLMFEQEPFLCLCKVWDCICGLTDSSIRICNFVSRIVTFLLLRFCAFVRGDVFDLDFVSLLQEVFAAEIEPCSATRLRSERAPLEIAPIAAVLTSRSYPLAKPHHAASSWISHPPGLSYRLPKCECASISNENATSGVGW